MMSRLGFWLVGLWVLIVVAPPSEARAETVEAAGDDSLAQSRIRFRAALALVDGGHHQEALAVFRQLQQERPHPILLFNIGLCLSRLEQHELAIEAFDAYLWQGNDDDPERRAEAQAEVDRLRALVEDTSREAEPASDGPAPQAEPPQPEPPGANLEAQPGLGLAPEATAPDLGQNPRLERQATGVHRAWFWTVAGMAVATGVGLAGVGGQTVGLSDRWMEEGNLADRDLGRTLQWVSEGLLIALACEAVALTILGLLTDFGGPPQDQHPAPNGH